jgi:hypothetical protein
LVAGGSGDLRRGGCLHPYLHAELSRLSRKELTYTLCEHLGWLTPAGRPKFTACAKLLGRLEDAGELRLPALQEGKSHPGARPGAARRPSARTHPAARFACSLSEETKHAWISSRPLQSAQCIHTRCNLGARYRWGIQGTFLVEKHQGYACERVFAKQYNATKGYHYLIIVAPGAPAQYLGPFLQGAGWVIHRPRQVAAIGFIRNTLTGPRLDPKDIELYA